LDAQRHFHFQYAPDWLGTEQAIPLSLSLPLQSMPFADQKARPFFANLLPEAAIRRAVALRLGISENNDFAMLEAIGGECAGAVSIIPADATITDAGDYRLLANEELRTIIENLPTRPLLAGEEGMRLSLAGAQHKLPVYVKDDQIYLPLGTLPSSHILKPNIPGFKDTVINEAYCMRLAKELGLSVPANIIHGSSGIPVYLIERYDRARDAGGHIHRIHQEDFCQALGVSPDAKYEKEGGPGLAHCVSLIREYSIQPVVDIKALLDWIVFNYLIGNADAHAKNISFLLLPEGPRLAPFYDLMCTVVYPNLSDRMAMRLGGEDRPDWITARKWAQCADDLGIKESIMRKVLVEQARDINERCGTVARVLDPEGRFSEMLASIGNVIDARVNKITRLFTSV
ncbi:MAG: type II toxin-antitoxin system HipA family toxin, partial [Gammaproteobacteria bacterium]|nr:type II toxin-antitoxin system HipA family toxin [Gammaproteobacteria bacterium]